MDRDLKKKCHYRSAKQVPLQKNNFNSLKNFAIKKKNEVFILHDLGFLFFKLPLKNWQADHFRHVVSDTSW